MRWTNSAPETLTGVLEPGEALHFDAAAGTWSITRCRPECSVMVAPAGNGEDASHPTRGGETGRIPTPPPAPSL